MAKNMMMALAGLGLLAGVSAVPAQAQGVPGGSYLQTCTNVQRMGDRLYAECRRMDGGWDRTALGGVDRCAGGIANTNGQLTCNHAWRRDRWDNEGYGSSRYYNPNNEWYGR